MFDNKIMYEIVEKIQEGLPIPMSICDVSGRVMVSTDSASVGDMNLLAIKALDINAKVFASSDSRYAPNPPGPADRSRGNGTGRF